MPPDLVSGVEWAKQLSPFGMLAFILFASYKGWWVWGREYRKLEQDRDEYKSLALRLGGIADGLVKKL